MRKTITSILLICLMIGSGFSQTTIRFGASVLKDTSSGFMSSNKGFKTDGDQWITGKTGVGKSPDATFQMVIKQAGENLLKLNYDDGASNTNATFGVDDGGLLKISPSGLNVWFGDDGHLTTVTANHYKVINSSAVQMDIDDRRVFANNVKKDSANTFYDLARFNFQTGDFLFDNQGAMTDRSFLFDNNGSVMMKINDLTGVTVTGAVTVGGQITANTDLQFTGGKNSVINNANSASNSTIELKFSGTAQMILNRSTGVEVKSGLTITGTTSFLTLPNMSTLQRTGLTAVAGMLVFDTDIGSVYAYNGSSWISLP